MTRSPFAVVAAAASLLLLSGCATVTHAPSEQPSEQQYEDYLAGYRDGAWLPLAGLDVERPADPEVVWVTQNDQMPALVDCMAEAGYPDYYHGEIGGTGDTVPEAYAEQFLADYLCQVTYIVDPHDFPLFSYAQLDYVYDYNQRFLVPCLELNGRDVTSMMPREEVTGPGMMWAPYSAYWGIDGFDPSLERDRDLLERCPPYPPDTMFDDWRASWG